MLVFVIAGLLTIGFGAIIRFAPMIDRRSRWYYPTLLLVIFFGAQPRSWIPWGIGLTLFGLGFGGGPLGTAAQLLSAIFVAAGFVFLVRAPSWMEPRSLSEPKE
jgi:hypothetical protein